MAKGITLKSKMILGGVIAVIVPFFIAGIIIYIQLSSALLEITKEKSLNIAKDISASIDERLNQEIRQTLAIAADPDIIEAARTGDYNVAQIELESIYERIGMDFFTILLADRYGIIKADAFFPQQIGINISDRDYFIKAKEGETSVVGPFLPRGSATPGEPVIVVCAPILDKNEFYGICALVFNTDFLVDILSRKKHGQTGHAFLINAEGLVLAHPKREFIYKLHLLDQPGTEEIKKLILGKMSGTAFYSFDGSEMIVGLAKMNLTGWIAAFAQSRREIMSPVDRILRAMFISGMIFLVITLLIIISFSSKISDPIHKIMEMMKHVMQHSNEIIMQIGLDRKIIFANPAFEKITGLKLDSVIGSEPNLDTPNNIPKEAIWESLEAGTPWSGRVAFKGSAPDPITLDVMLVPFIDDHNAVQGYLEIGRDITGELMYEKKLHQTQKLEAIGTLAGGIAHDFNNILGMIFGYAELALMKKDIDPETENYIEEILLASERARDLVSQILTFSRKTEVTLKPLAPKDVLKEALKLLRASIPATINIESKIESDSVIMAAPTQVHQVVMNLFTNAVHAIGEKNGTIKLELEDFMVDEEFTKTHPDINQGKHIILRVSDTGSGIKTETLDHIFEPFFTTKSQGKGTGLGLSVVHGIVKRLNGIITIYSELGKGTTFNIIIPCVTMDDSNQPHNDLTTQEERLTDHGRGR